MQDIMIGGYMAGKFNLQTVLLGFVGTILIAAISFFGASILDGLKKINQDSVEIQLIKKDLETIIEDLSEVQGVLVIISSDDTVSNLNTEIKLIEARVKNLEERP